MILPFVLLVLVKQHYQARMWLRQEQRAGDALQCHLVLHLPATTSALCLRGEHLLSGRTRLISTLEGNSKSQRRSLHCLYTTLQ